MRKNLYVLVTALTVTFGLAARNTAYAQLFPNVQTCQPGLEDAFNGPNNAHYSTLVNALLFSPVVPWDQVTAHLQDVVNEADGGTGHTNDGDYAALLADARALSGSVPSGRVLITLPDGTVVIDTARSDDPAIGNSNTFAHYKAKAINENHQSRIAIEVTQHYQCGYGLECKLSSSTGRRECYFARRAGAHLDGDGTVRISSAP